MDEGTDGPGIAERRALETAAVPAPDEVLRRLDARAEAIAPHASSAWSHR